MKIIGYICWAISFFFVFCFALSIFIWAIDWADTAYCVGLEVAAVGAVIGTVMIAVLCYVRAIYKKLSDSSENTEKPETEADNND